MRHTGVNPGEQPEYIIVGLGNPGKRYENTRHNIGFKIVDYLNSKAMLSRGCKRSLHYSLIDKCVLGGRVVIMVEPQTFMNNSGIAVQDIMHYHRMNEAQLIVIHDDITLPVGHFKIKKGGSAGGHNGIKSIIQHLGTGDFIHIKIGVGQKPEGWELANYVLSKIPDIEYKKIENKFELIAEALENMFNFGLERTMSVYNPLGADKGV